ncbi:low molecular weight protein-tyrosine-phosphatase [Halobacillus kuroshimensis]|uniref:low molecular weight protein-tyrosine-phosphatase n=1 Tax=Halobacillus kuroshimensis TaxID=302481 RepID=UPI000483434D|nr:low molecular weight protein-tyrosine-phosphatase [Halobacillus kuroshimensis]
MIRVLFVCLGNICRSPMAEAVFRNLVEKENLSSQITVDSAGTGHWHTGSQPHEGTQDILDKNNVSYEGMTARQVKGTDWDEFDYLVAMDEKNIRDLYSIRQKDGVTITKLMDYLPQLDVDEVPDPYYTGNFDYVYELVQQGCAELLAAVKKEHNL